MKTYLVGGAVRNKLLNLPVHDRDWVVVGSSPEELLELGFTQVGKDFPVFLHPQTHEEYALARTERSTGPGYRGFTVYAATDVTLEQDLLRRDLTINAIAMDENGNLIDPFNGQQDIKDRKLRHVSMAFTEDPVRVLRIARFAAQLATFKFTIAKETQQLISQMLASGEVDALVPERVWQELVKALKCDHPRRFFETLQDCGVLEKLFPELHRLFGVPQPAKWHPEVDTGIHTLMVLDKATELSDDPRVRFAALCHDLGKGLTPADNLPSHPGHEEVSAKLTQQLCQRMAVPNDYKDLAVLVARYHSHCHRAFELKAIAVLKTLQKLDAIRRPERFEAFLVSCEADARGRKHFENSAYPQADYLRGALQAILKVDAGAIARSGLSGREIGDQIARERLEQVKTWKTQYPLPESGH